MLNLSIFIVLVLGITCGLIVLAVYILKKILKK